jgi:hypothetical protein
MNLRNKVLVLVLELVSSLTFEDELLVCNEFFFRQRQVILLLLVEVAEKFVLILEKITAFIFLLFYLILFLKDNILLLGIPVIVN